MSCLFIPNGGLTILLTKLNELERNEMNIWRMKTKERRLLSKKEKKRLVFSVSLRLSSILIYIFIFRWDT